MFVSTIDDSIKEVKARIEELEPAVAEHRMLGRTLRQLEDLKLHDEDPEAWAALDAKRKEAVEKSKQEYVPKAKRIEQIVELIAAKPEITNVAIADALGVSAARISQLRPLAEDSLAERKPGEQQE